MASLLKIPVLMASSKVSLLVMITSQALPVVAKLTYLISKVTTPMLSMTKFKLS